MRERHRLLGANDGPDERCDPEKNQNDWEKDNGDANKKESRSFWRCDCKRLAFAICYVLALFLYAVYLDVFDFGSVSSSLDSATSTVKELIRSQLNAINNSTSREEAAAAAAAAAAAQEKPGVHVVVAYCDKPIDWIWQDYLANITIKSAFILTTCEKSPPSDNLPPSLTIIPVVPSIVSLFEHHAYAYFVSLLVSESQEWKGSSSISGDDMLLFVPEGKIEATDTMFTQMGFEDSKSKLPENNFVCTRPVKDEIPGLGQTPTILYSALFWKRQSVEWHFPKEGLRGRSQEPLQAGVSGEFKSPSRPLGTWMTAMGMGEVPDSEVVQVCLGGSFLTTVGQVKEVSRAKNLNWTTITNSLARAVNTEEPHLMRATWGALFSNPLSQSVKVVAGNNLKRVCAQKNGFHGMMLIRGPAPL